MLAGLIIGIPILIVVLILGLVKSKIMRFFPSVDKILKFLVLLGWPLVIYGVYDVNRNSWDGAELYQWILLVAVVSFFYWIAVLACKLACFPLKFVTDSTPVETRKFQDQEQKRINEEMDPGLKEILTRLGKI